MKRIYTKQGCCYLLIAFAAILLSSFITGFDRSAYYQVMENGKAAVIDQQIKTIESVPQINRNAYTGALLMKKAGIISGVFNKLNAFKDGHEKLESAIKSEPKNTEFRFLRLLIQENAPRILGYSSEIDEDAGMIRNAFVSLPAEVKAAVLNYRRQSKALQKLSF